MSLFESRREDLARHRFLNPGCDPLRWALFCIARQPTQELVEAPLAGTEAALAMGWVKVLEEHDNGNGTHSRVLAPTRAGLRELDRALAERSQDAA